MSEILNDLKCMTFSKNDVSRIENDAYNKGRADAIDELSIRCIAHIKHSKPLTIEEVIHIIHFEADEMKGSK